MQVSLRTVIGQFDAVSLIVIAFTAATLVPLNVVPDRIIFPLLFFLLGMLAVHQLHYGFRIESAIKKSDRLHGKGVLDVFPKRFEIPPTKMHNDIREAKEVFILTRYFTAFVRYDALKKALGECLQRGGKVRILLYAPKSHHLEVRLDPDMKPRRASETIKDTLEELEKFRRALTAEQRGRFSYRVLNDVVVTVWMFGTESKLYATALLNRFTGHECPTIVCKSILSSPESIYSRFKDEFEHLWGGAVDAQDYRVTNCEVSGLDEK